MRLSKIQDVLEILSFNPEGWLWSELEGRHTIVGRVNGEIKRREIYLPRKTLDRNLKRLIGKGIVEKTVEKTGKKGRPAGRYKIASGYRLCMQIHVKKIGKVWFPGRIIERLGKSHVRLTGKWLEDYMEHRDWLKEHEPQEYEKWLKSERQKERRRRYARSPH